ncbi:MAG: hypothetical protein ACOCYO_08865, partial [Bacteroidota bacterium]
EWFGGTVNVTNVVSWNAGDDALDTDQSWGGTVDNFVIISPGDHNFELDGPEGSMAAGHIMQNGTVIANTNDQNSSDIINVDDNSIVTLRNIHFMNLEEGQIINRVDAPEVIFENITLDVPEEDLANYVVDGNVPSGVTAGGSPQADVSVFDWTWASKAGALDGLK